MTAKDTRPAVHIKLDPTTRRELHALADRDGSTMTQWIVTTIRRAFRDLPKDEQAKWLPVDQGNPAGSRTNMENER